MSKRPAPGRLTGLIARRRWLPLLLAVMAIAWLGASQGRDSGAGAPQEERTMNTANPAAATRPELPPIDLWKPGRTETAVFALG